ncbi:serum response factor homolog isoform X2 [Limulus polyphemus]|uniref:Serum response factor homolog isoform X2 n=1 Tax=Limulus polyphemus TaxID=6850 RepID=A0ABM1TS40_LIMPO|nr:serum response factor homolog isoform X2 [Limulus polyphemus]
MQRVSSVGHESNHAGLMIENVDPLTQGFSGDSEEDSREEDAGSPGGEKRTAEAAGLPGRSENEGGNASDKSKKTTPPNGKKTKGRVKIKMEFIDNKLRRYTTFSKRKTGIMKKAYELSTLTGTQVMLLVASETGHVYTFATRKLQPMITSEAGKALIQTCLNSPDPPAGPGGSGPDQRMSATGFEETELVYSVNEDTENKS